MSYNVLNRKRYGEMVEHVRRYGCECSSHTIKWSYLYIMYVEITHITKRLDREGMICLSNEWWNVCTTTIPALRISYIHIWYTYTYIHTYTHTYICIHTYIHTYIHMLILNATWELNEIIKWQLCPWPSTSWPHVWERTRFHELKCI